MAFCLGHWDGDTSGCTAETVGVLLDRDFFSRWRGSVEYIVLRDLMIYIYPSREKNGSYAGADAISSIEISFVLELVVRLSRSETPL